jgi:ceramide glucosyltransferase
MLDAIVARIGVVMFSLPVSICLAISAAALLLHRVSVWATVRHLRSEHHDSAAATQLPALTVLKPIKGLEEQLEQNLRSFFEQSYPAALQFVFSSTEVSDPGIAMARRVAADYPACDVRFVNSDAAFGYNPKVSNLAGALRAATHELVLQSDANVRVRPGYLQAFVREFEARGAALMGGLVAGRGERSLGAALDTVQLTSFTSPGVCLAECLAGIPCVIGKAILFRRSELAALGGLELVKDVLAEDFVLGDAYLSAGKRVVISKLVVDNVNVDTSLRRFLARHSRWLKMRVVLHVPGFLADLLSNSSFFALLAAALSGGQPELLGLYVLVASYKLVIDARQIARVRGEPLAAIHLVALPLRDLLLPCLWLYALFSRTTEWRGERFRLARGSQLTPLNIAEPLRDFGK